MKEIDLAGSWKMEILNTKEEYPATLPGSDIGNLVKLGAVENPLFLGDDKTGEKLGEREIDFERTFDLDESCLEYEHIELKSKSFDTLCTVFINGKEVGKTENAHLCVAIDIKNYVNIGENSIRLHFNSSVNYIKERQKNKPLPKNANGTDGAAYIRKPSCHFGWDWGPCVPYCGVNEYITVKCFNREIKNISIKQETTEEKSVVKVSGENVDKIYMISPNGGKITGEKGVFTIENPCLWYTADMSGEKEQPLYTVHFENDEETLEKKIGLRSLYLDTSKDEYGKTFRFILNGKRVFAKGANLIPFSAIYEDSDNSTVDYYLDLAQKSNFNILRVWGGGSYANEYFMEQCDKRGILVWQDYCFACLMYPFYEEDFLNNVIREVKENTARLSTHPSLALLCGNNEIEVMFSYMPKTTELVKSYIDFFYTQVPKAIENITQTSYIPSSPLGEEPFKNCTGDNTGDTHMWSVWHGLKKLDYYQTRYTRFLSEFGLESLPSMKAIRTFAAEDNLSITSESFNRHQKCTGGNRKMLFYLKEMFHDPKHFEDLPYLTGIIQAECVRNACIHFRQNPDRCNGVVYWQYNDVWNCPSWSSVDFEGVPKALQYKAKEFFEPVTVTCKNRKGQAVLFAHNDTLKPVSFTVSVKTDDGKINKTYNVNLASNETLKLDSLKVRKTAFMTIAYLNKIKTEVFSAPKNLKLKKANITYSIEGNRVKIKSDVFAFGVCIESDTLPEDNYFNMYAGEERTVVFDKAPQQINIKCANNIEYEVKPIKEKLWRFLYRLEPLNIGNYFYYTFN